VAPVPPIDFRTHPDRYRHWRIEIEAPLAFLTMRVDESGGLLPGYDLKLNSYDLGVDIELHDAMQRLRFEHPGVKDCLTPPASSMPAWTATPAGPSTFTRASKWTRARSRRS
jgi:hypothetical protein